MERCNFCVRACSPGWLRLRLRDRFGTADMGVTDGFLLGTNRCTARLALTESFSEPPGPYATPAPPPNGEPAPGLPQGHSSSTGADGLTAQGRRCLDPSPSSSFLAGHRVPGCQHKAAVSQGLGWPFLPCADTVSLTSPPLRRASQSHFFCKEQKVDGKNMAGLWIG